MEHTEFLKTLPTELREALTNRSDRKGLLHLFGYLAIFLIALAAVAAGIPFWPVFLWPLGLMLAFLFTLMHDTRHKTAFRPDLLNETCFRACGIILGMPPIWFR